MTIRHKPLIKARILYLATILALILSVAPQALPGVDVPTASAHNLQTKMVYMFFDPNTQNMLDARIAGPTWTPPTPLLQVGDELGIIVKVVPRDGTTTGVGGHVDFYVPNGTTVIDAAYLLPGDANPADGISGYDKVPMKGQSLIATGAGPIGAKATTQLIGLGAVGPNVLGFSTDPVVPSSGLHRGTIAGVYGDTGIFYATDPDTSYGSWQRFTGDPDKICGLAGTPGLTGKTITNNSGDVFVPCNKWDAEQMYAWGVKGTTYTGAGAATAPIVDYGDGRGNAPWGFASGVGGPQSGYAWNFNWDEWAASPKTAVDMRAAMGNDEVGPWKRIRYTGSRISSDNPGSASTGLGIASVDGGSTGYALSPSNPLPATTSQTDTTSPKAIRWAVGQLTNLVPEFVWVKIKVNNTAAIVNADGCPVFQADTFGGDAGGDNNGKDHLWRYYEPSRATWNGCLALGKPATRDVVRVGDTYQYKVKVYNAGTTNDFTNVVVRDTLPSGVQFINAFPAQASGPNPLVWNVPSLRRGEMWEATVTVKATGTGVLENTVCVDAPGTTFDQCAEDDTISGSFPLLRQGKSATPTTLAPGANVQYTIQIDNIGSGPTGSPITVQDYLPSGLTFVSKDLVTINGANVTATTTVNTSSPYSANQPLITVPGALNAGQSLIIRFTANVPLGAPTGTYCNSYTTTQSGTPLTTGSLACITVGGGAIGDTIFRDWNGNGVQDLEDEGIEGVTVSLTGPGCAPCTTTTDASGNYVFEGLAAGSYTVTVTDLGPDGLPASGDELLTGYTQTYDPNGVCPGPACNGQSTVTIATGERNLDQDFGYEPGGTGSIGDTLWKDDGSGGGTAGNGAQDGAEPGIANVTVFLYEDTNGNGAIDPDDALVATDVTDANGNYGFTGLALNLNYLVRIDEADPDFTAAFGGGPISASTPRLQGAQPTTDTPAIDTVDFGYFQPPPASVGDTVCIDTNADRLCTGADTPLPNIDVLLYGDTNGNGILDPGEPLLATDSTDANGVYGFANLPAGPYVVVVDTADPNLPGGLATTRNPQSVTLAPGETNLTIDFPFVQRLTKAVRNVTTNQNPGANANPGDVLEYTITPSYTGSNPLTNLKVTDGVPTGTSFLSAGQGGTQSGGVVTWNLGSTVLGSQGQVGASDYIYALSAKGSQNFYRYNIGANSWTQMANIPSNVTWGGALTTDGVYVYALPAGDTQLFYRYDTSANTWTARANVPAKVKEGGALTFDGTNLFALTAKDSKLFYRYNLGANTWTARADIPSKVSLTGALTRLGSNIYGLTAKDTQLFYRYDIAANTWAARANVPAKVKEGGALTTDGTYVYALTAKDSKNFYRYDPAANTWAARANITANVFDGGALTYDGTYIYALVADDSQAFYRYDIAGNTWASRANIPAKVKEGGALVYLQGGATTTVALEVDRSLVANGDTIKVTMRATAVGAISNVSPTTLTVTDLNSQGAGVTPANCGSATLTSADDDISGAGDEVTYTWTCQAVVGTGTGNIRFSGSATGTGGTFGTATSNSVLAIVPLTYQVTVNNPPTVGEVTNTAQISDDTRTIPPTDSNETNTVLPSGSIGDFVWYDTNGNGLQDETDCAGSPCGAPNATLVLVNDLNGNGVADIGEPVVDTYVTDSTGAYLFDNLPPGNYVVVVSEQEIPSPTSGNVNTMVGTLGTSAAVSLGLAQNVTNVDFGFVEAATVEGTVFHDVNHNGVLDPGEPVLPNVTVTLTGTDLSGNPVTLTTTTDANGGYFFVTPPGNYTISYNTADPDIPPALSEPTTPTNINLSVNAGVEYTGLDFGVDDAGRIGDRVWNDANGNGVQNAGEPGLANVTVYLCTSTPCTSANAIAITATDANGNYEFVGLPDGTYYVGINQATVPAGFTQTGYGDPGTPCGACNGQSPAVPITGGNTVTNVDFGYRAPLGDPAFQSVSGTVWEDSNGNGQSTGEAGIPGVTVCLFNSTGTTAVACTTTDGNGNYLFPGVPNGSYIVRVDPTTLPSAGFVQTGDPSQPGVPCTTCDNQNPITVNNAPVTNQNFGYQQPLGSISGTICEGNGNGDCVGGEPTLAGVPVFLTYAGTDGIFGTPDDQVFSTTTDGSGNYSFPNLPAGNYQVTKADPAGTTSLADADGGNPNNISIALAPGQNLPNQDFEVKPALGQIGDRVWLDTDGDGVQDIGEPGLSNVVVELRDSLNNLVGTATTDMNGNYLFTNVPPGNYLVDVVSGVPANLVASPGTTDPRPVTLAAGQSYLDADFGYTGPAGAGVIGDFVWADVDGDGIQDPGEAGIGGVTVDLRGPGPDGILGTGDDTTVATVTTDPDGSYLFTNVSPGQYLVQVSGAPLAGYTPTTGPQSEGATTSTPVTVAAGDVVTDVDFGFDRPALYSISDRVWFDTNRNGTLDPGESGIGGVTVNLLDSNGNVIATTISNPDGTFTFPGVPNGSYTIQIADNTGVLTDLQATTPSATAGQRPVVVAGSDVTGTNFGYAGLGPIGDTIWSDANGNGVQDPGELGIGGVTVNLYFDDGDGVFEPGAGDVLIATEVTDAAGQYLFSNLPQGSFWVSVTPPGGYTQTGDPSQPGVPCTTCDNRGLATLTPINPSDLSMDFGYRNTALADVSGTVWNDTNSNGVQDPGENGIPGVTVCLTNSAGEIVACTETDANGNYTFPDVPPGNYTVVVTDEAGVLDGHTLTSGLDTIPVTVANTDITDVDFGYVRNPATGAIGDTVWFDANGDGAQNGAESGLPNVVVELRDGAGNPIDSDPNTSGIQPTLTTTDLNGNYLFSGLPAGNYQVVVVSGVPAGLAATTLPPAVINLSTGELYPDADFGYTSTTGAAMGDFVWHDVNGDGIQDPGEPGVGGVTVTVTGPSCPAGCTVVTDPDGSWLVPGLAPGSYTVTVTPPPGYTATPTNGAATRTIVMPPSGEDVLYADFGFTGGPTGALGDTIYLDANGNGTQDGGEPGIAGVTVSLLNNSGQVIATTVTDANGQYSFPGLPDGTYTVVVTDVGNILAGLKQTQDPDQAGVCTTCNDRGTRTINGGAVDNSVDFGYAPIGGVIGNQLWHDKDGDGLYEPLGNDGLPNTPDDEDGIQGVLINLFLDTNNNGILDPGVDNLVRTTTTDVNGQYQFIGLPAGQYLVDVASSNFAAGSVLQGFAKTTGPTPGANNNSQADPYVVTLTSTGGVVSSNFTADFGYDATTPFSIAGTTFNDLNNNGPTVPTQEPGEPPIANVTVYLYRDLNGDGIIGPEDPVIGSAVTNATGDYLFTDLPPGTYLVSTNALSSTASGTFQTTQKTTPATGVQPVTITAANVVDQDFGFHQFAGGPLAVQLAGFWAVFGGDAITLAWETVSEIDHLGFNVYRAETPDGPWTLVNGGLLPSPTPGSTQGNVYELVDSAAPLGGTVWYQLEAVDVYGATEIVGSTSVYTGPSSEGTPGVSTGPLLEEPSSLPADPSSEG